MKGLSVTICSRQAMLDEKCADLMSLFHFDIGFYFGIICAYNLFPYDGDKPPFVLLYEFFLVILVKLKLSLKHMVILYPSGDTINRNL